MAISLELIDTSMTKLWDYGWFDVSQFSILGASRKQLSETDVLANLLKDSLFQRSFCMPGPWGEMTETHGPFHIAKLHVQDFQRVPSSEIVGRFQAVFESQDFSGPPEPEQLEPVNDWTQRMVSFCAAAYLIDLSMCPGDQVDWSHVWTAFREVICINLDRSEIEIAVIGYD